MIPAVATGDCAFFHIGYVQAVYIVMEQGLDALCVCAVHAARHGHTRVHTCDKGTCQVATIKVCVICAEVYIAMIVSPIYTCGQVMCRGVVS